MIANRRSCSIQEKGRSPANIEIVRLSGMMPCAMARRSFGETKASGIRNRTYLSGFRHVRRFRQVIPLFYLANLQTTFLRQRSRQVWRLRLFDLAVLTSVNRMMLPCLPTERAKEGQPSLEAPCSCRSIAGLVGGGTLTLRSFDL